jgi:WD40 repeat protein
MNTHCIVAVSTVFTVANILYAQVPSSSQQPVAPSLKRIDLAGRKVVASWPNTNRMPPFVASPDSAHVAWVLARDGVTYLSIDGKEKVLGPSIRVATPQWSRDSKRVALKVWKGEEQSQFLDDKIGNWYETVQGGRFTSDYKFGYTGLKNGKWFQVADGAERQSIETSVDDVKAPVPAIYSTGNSKFLAIKGANKGKMWFVVNGKKQDEYDWVGEFYISPDGQHYAYVTQTNNIGVNKNSQQAYVVDGVLQQSFDEAGSGLGQPSWSPDGKMVAFPFKAGFLWFVGQQSLKLNGAPSPLRPYIKPEQSIEEFLKSRSAPATPNTGWHSEIDTLMWSPDSKQLAYIAKQGKKMLVVTNRQPGPIYDYISHFTPSPDGKRHAYIAWQAGKRQMIIDGKANKQYADVYAPLWSPDSKRIAYKAQTINQWIVVSDSQESEEYEKVGTLAWSPDSKHLAYAVTDEDAPTGVPDSYQWWKDMKAKQPNFGNKLVVDEVATDLLIDPLTDSYPTWADSKTLNVLMVRGNERNAGESTNNHYLDVLNLKIIN